MGEKKKKCAYTSIFQIQFSFFLLCFCICLLACTGGPCWYFWYFWSVLPQILIHFPVLWIPLRTCLEERNQAWGRHIKKWQQSHTRYFSGAPGPLLVLKNRKCLSPCPEVWAGLDPWISSPTNHPRGAEERKRLKCGFSFWEASAEGEGKGAKFWFNLTSSDAPGSTSFVHRSAFLHLLLEKSQKRSLT